MKQKDLLTQTGSDLVKRMAIPKDLLKPTDSGKDWRLVRRLEIQTAKQMPMGFVTERLKETLTDWLKLMVILMVRRLVILTVKPRRTEIEMEKLTVRPTDLLTH